MPSFVTLRQAVWGRNRQNERFFSPVLMVFALDTRGRTCPGPTFSAVLPVSAPLEGLHPNDLLVPRCDDRKTVENGLSDGYGYATFPGALE